MTRSKKRPSNMILARREVGTEIAGSSKAQGGQRFAIVGRSTRNSLSRLGSGSWFPDLPPTPSFFTL